MNTPRVMPIVLFAVFSTQIIEPAVAGKFKKSKTDPQTSISKDGNKTVQENNRVVKILKDGSKKVREVNQKGNNHGKEEVYNAKGRLLSECYYVDGSHDGKCVFYFPESGKPQRVEWYVDDRLDLSVEYREDGKLANLKCGKKAYFDVDRKLCGWDAPSDVELINSNGNVVQKLRFEKGQTKVLEKLSNSRVYEKKEFQGRGDALLKKTEFFKNGRPKIEAEYRGERLHGKEVEFHESGPKIRETNWDEGQMVSETQLYLNGQVKEKTSRTAIKDGEGIIERRQYWDNGKLKSQGSFAQFSHSLWWSGFHLTRWLCEKPIGQHKSYYEDGTIQEESNFNRESKRDGLQKYFFPDGKIEMEEVFSNGVRKSSKEWDLKGALKSSEEYFEDGSRRRQQKSR